MTKFRNDTFTHILVGDVVQSQARLSGDDSQFHRRDLIRATFAAIEGLHWRLKQNVLNNSRRILSAHEYAAMMEESYSVNKRGEVESMPRFVPLTASIRLIVSVVKKYQPNYSVDFGHRGWSNLNHAIEVRNRLVHPKAMADLTVLDCDITKAISGFHWMLALVIEILEETKFSLEEYTKETSKRREATLNRQSKKRAKRP